MKIKIPIRLKITEWSKNYRLKILVRVRALVCVRVRMIVINSHHGTRSRHQRNTGHQKREQPRATRENLNLYACLQPMKKSIKKSKKIWKYKKTAVSLQKQ